MLHYIYNLLCKIVAEVTKNKAFANVEGYTRVM